MPRKTKIVKRSSSVFPLLSVGGGPPAAKTLLTSDQDVPPDEILPDFSPGKTKRSREKFMREYRRLNIARQKWIEKKPTSPLANADTKLHAGSWVPRRFSELEKSAILTYVSPKFKELADKVRRLERGEEHHIKERIDSAGNVVKVDETIISGKAVTMISFGSVPVPVKDLSEKQLRHILALLTDPHFGAHDDIKKSRLDADAEAFIKKYLWAKNYIRKEERGIKAILRNWSLWLCNELSGEDLFMISGRPLPKRASQRKRIPGAILPLDVAAEITRKLIKKHFSSYKAFDDQIKKLMAPFWVRDTSDPPSSPKTAE